MQLAESQETLLTLGEAGALTAMIIQGVAGNEIADTLNGSELTNVAIAQMAQSVFHRKVVEEVGVI